MTRGALRTPGASPAGAAAGAAKPAAADELAPPERALRTLLGCGEAFASAGSQEDLLAGACRLLVDVSGFRVSVAARAVGDEPAPIRPVAYRSPRRDDFAAVRRAWRAAQRADAGLGIAATALRTRRPVVANDLFTHELVAPPVREDLARVGLAAAAAMPVASDDGRPLVLVAVSARRDDFDPLTMAVLERVAASLSEALSAMRTRELLTSVVVHAPIPFYLVTADARVALVNRAWEGTVGRPRAEVIGKRLDELFPVGGSAFLEVNTRVLTSGQALEVEETAVVRGRPRVFETVKFPVRDADGHVTAVAGFSVDVTDRRRAADRLRFQARLLDELSDPVVAVDPEERLTYANSAALERYAPGTRLEDVLGRRISELYEYRWNAPSDLEAAEAALATANVWRGDLLHVRAGGVTWPVEATVVALSDERGRPAGYCAVMRDVSRQKETERALRDSREALRAHALRLQTIREEEKTRIARDLHDDLGQLVTMIKLDVSAVERRLEALEPHVAGALLDRVVAASDLIDRLAGSVQRIASELRSSVLDELGLGAALEHEGELLRQRSGVAFVARVYGDAQPLPPDVATALYRIAQEAFTNVVRHAAAKRVDLELHIRASDVVLVVEDDGRGMPADAGGRRGLGVLGMRERTLALGGELRVETRPGGGGTRVTARVPLAVRGGRA